MTQTPEGPKREIANRAQGAALGGFSFFFARGCPRTPADQTDDRIWLVGVDQGKNSAAKKASKAQRSTARRKAGLRVFLFSRIGGWLVSAST
jgi:hypothetical protein